MRWNTGYIFQTSRYQTLKLVEKHAHRISGKTLDVGCGPVARYQKLFNCSEYVKMDVEEGENVDIVGTAEAIPFGNESFDAIVCTEVIQDVFEIIKAFTEFNRVLKQGGVLMVSSASIAKSDHAPGDYWRFTPHSFRRLAEDSGLHVEVLEQKGAFWSAMTQLWVSYWILKLSVYGKWYERLFGITSSMLGKVAMWLDTFERGTVRSSFTNGYLMIARKR